MGSPALAVDRFRADRAIVLLAAAAITALAWAALALPHVHHAGFAVSFAMWMVMMVGMMLPPVMPWILFFAEASRDREGTPPYLRVAIFSSGYFAVWAAYSFAAAVGQTWLTREGVLDAMELRTGPWVAGTLLIGAGLFQWSPLKTACLAHCRSPMAFFLSRWRGGPIGAFEMGFRHGLYCVTCCWALMVVCFGLGVMNLVWMAALTLMLCLEKIAPRGLAIGRVWGLVLIGWGAKLLLG